MHADIRNPVNGRFLLAAVALSLAAGPFARATDGPSAKAILEATGVRGGLVVHLGCGDGRLTAAMGALDGFLVQGLDADAAKVEAARGHIRSQGLYGQVSAAQLRGPRLPYVDNLVNLLVAEELGQVPPAEVMRVLAPGGVAYVKEAAGPGATWRTTVKPRPAEIDEWTHFLHDASNNPVARDTVVGPPRRMQWVGSPLYGRHHDRMSSVSAAVSAGGRVFYILDEGSRISILAPPKWFLIARDAFNGTILWKRPIGQWHNHLLGLKSGPALLPRRLLAVGDRVYVTLGLDEPLTALDAATGQTVRTYEPTRLAREAILSEGVLLVVVDKTPAAADEPGGKAQRGPKPQAWWGEGEKRILAVRAETGETLWSAERWVVPLTLAAAGRHALFLEKDRIACLDRDTGGQVWQSEPLPRCESVSSQFAPTLVVHDGVVLFAGGETAGKLNRTWYTQGEDTLTALSAETGKVLWKAYHPPSGYASPEDVFVAGGLVWTGETTSGRAAGVFTGRDLRTGEVRSEFPPDVQTYWFHHRCHRGKATENYLLPSRTGIEFIDFRQKHWVPNHWVRGACLYGVMPCNGLIYAPPHPCACYLESKLNGFNALAAAGEGPRIPDAELKAERLDKGPAYAEADPPPAIGDPRVEDWPTYRHDAARSGRASTTVPAELKPAWQAAIGGRLSAPVVAGGMVFVAAVDAHTVHALDAGSGRGRWRYTAEGRIDSPPTVWRGRVLFGSADGHVYCLRASDGALVWRFRAAPMDQRLAAFEQVESVWPVPGSVLVAEEPAAGAAGRGVACFVAGRSMFLDGGMRLWRLDAAAGSVLSETVLDDRGEEADQTLQSYVSWLNMPVALPDVLSSDGRLMYMRSQPFALDGTRLPLAKMPSAPDADRGAPPATQRPDRAHLFSPTGFLDDSWWHRTYWMYGSTFVSGWCGYFLAGKAAPAGRILAFDDEKVYGFGRKPEYYRWTTQIEHQLFAADRPGPRGESAAEARRTDAPAQGPKLHWTEDLPLLARGMVLAGPTLFLAGPPDLVDEPQAMKSIGDPQVRKALEDQDAAWAGAKGGLLWAVAAADGRKLAEHKLDAPPVFDGLVAAAGRLYAACIDGKVICFQGR